MLSNEGDTSYVKEQWSLIQHILKNDLFYKVKEVIFVIMKE